VVDRTAGIFAAEEAPVRQLLGTLLSRRWLIAGPAIVAVMLALAWLRATPAEYRAFMVVGPTETLDRAAAAGTAGSSAGGDGVADFSRFLALLTSVEMARRLSGADWVLPALFPEAWDAAARRWHPPDGLAARATRAGARLLGRDGWRPPGPEALAERLAERLSVGPVGSSGLRRIGLRHADRETALRLLALLHATADGLVREAAAAGADARIGYLQDRLAEVAQVAHRSALEALLMEQERRRMLIQADLPYAATLLERPAAPPLADWPDPALVLALAAVCGLFTGLTLAFAAEGLSRSADAA
jgi:hypothetical protein